MASFYQLSTKNLLKLKGNLFECCKVGRTKASGREEQSIDTRHVSEGAVRAGLVDREELIRDRDRQALNQTM